MKKQPIDRDQQTAVDDVRAIREAIAARHRGKMREHMAETNRIFEELKEELGLTVIGSNPARRKHRRSS